MTTWTPADSAPNRPHSDDEPDLNRVLALSSYRAAGRRLTSFGEINPVSVTRSVLELHRTTGVTAGSPGLSLR